MKFQIFFFIFAILIGPAHAQSPELFQMVRALQELQTGMAFGKIKLREDQVQVVSDIGRQMATADVGIWRDVRNRRAGIIWLLSGGSPQIMRRALTGEPWAEPELQIALGSLAFVEGRAAQARDILLTLDSRHLDPALGGQISLVQAALVLPESLDKAIHYLALARLIAPGTLVEETALRRQISLVGDTTDAASFAALSRQYMRRFARSLYAEDFRHAFATTFTRIGISAKSEQVEQLAPILDGFDADERCRLAILIARASLIEGAWISAITFAGRVMQPPVADSCDVPRARLYSSAARIFEPDAGANSLALEKLDPDRLSEEDQALRKASLHIAALVSAWPAPVPPETDTGLSGQATWLAAQKALSESQKLFTEKRR
jgi:chemotaxis protein MotC